MNLLLSGLLKEIQQSLCLTFFQSKIFSKFSECQEADVPFGWVEALWKVGKLDTIDMGN